MEKWTIDEFQKKILKAQVVPSDLAIIIESKCCLDILEEELEFELFEEGRIEKELLHSYISDDDKKDISIVANIFAINKVFESITFFAEAENGILLGYWHGEANTNILEASLVTYNTEGEFELLYGNQIVEQLILKWTSEDEDEYSDMVDEFSSCNIEISSMDTITEITSKSNPDELHSNLYSQRLEELKQLVDKV